MRIISRDALRRCTTAVAALGVATALTTAAFNTSAQAAPAARGADVPVSVSASGKVTVGTAAAKTAATTESGGRGSGRLADASGYSLKRKFPRNVRMLDGGKPTDVTPETVIGADGRTQITATTTYPNRVVGKLTFTAPNGGTYGCTAFLYGNNTVGTSGHCVYSHSAGVGWNSNFVFWPGKNGASNPYGSCGWSNANSVSGWTSSANPEYDYGSIRLNCTIGNTTGWIGMAWQTASYTGVNVNITGYPGDKAYGTMWQMSGPVTSSAVRQLFYSIDTFGGQSGSAVRISGCGTYCAIAVHSYGLYGGSPYNRGTRITEAAFNNFMTWKA